MNEQESRKAGRTDGALAARPYAIAVFEGDGIGPEVMGPTLELMELVARLSGEFEFQFDHLPAGAGHYRDSGEALPDASIEAARQSDAILLSAMGLPEIRYPDGTEITPQIDLRMIFGLYAGVRPVIIAPNQNSPLKSAENGLVDFVIVRESTEGLFASLGKGTVEAGKEARETLVITRATSEKLFRFAFELAARRKSQGRGPGRVHCVDKANVFKAFAFFRDIFKETAKQHTDIEAQFGYVDAVALWMVQKPEIFDVMVTENMFGDILSDLGAGLMGSLGLAPSADIGDQHAVFQPCHGSAPDIAGRGIANPTAMILSAALMMDWLGTGHGDDELIRCGALLHEAVFEVLRAGKWRTPDIGGSSSTGEVATAIADAYAARFEATR